MSDKLIQPIILAGGFGTRLRERVSDRPKALADVAGSPFLDKQLSWLQDNGFKQAIIAAGYKAEQLQAYADSYNQSHDFLIEVVVEDHPLGTGGAAANAIHECQLQGDVLIVNGDTYFNCQLDDLINWYSKHDYRAAVIAACVDNVARYGTICLENEVVSSFQQASGLQQPGYVSAGITLINSQLLLDYGSKVFSLENDLLPSLCQKQQLMAFRLQGADVFYDIGTPIAYDQFCEKMSVAHE